jgi:hypothetical protein
MRCLLSLLLVFNVTGIFAQIYFSEGKTASQISTVGISAIQFEGNRSFSNPAFLPLETQSLLYINGRNYFSDRHLNEFSVAYQLPTASMGVFGLAMTHFGTGDFQHQSFTLSYGRVLLDNFSLGVNFIGYRLDIPGYFEEFAMSVSLGARASFSNDFQVGFFALNPLGISLDGERLPSSFRLGLITRPSQVVHLMFEVEKPVDFDPSYRIGFAYFPLEKIGIYSGFQYEPVNIGLGVSYAMRNKLVLTLGSNYHSYLGFSPAASLRFKFERS